MNEKNEAIIRILARQAGLSSRALSKMIGLPISTVHRRIQRLEGEGDVVVAFISSRVPQKFAPTDIIINENHPEFRRSAFKAPSKNLLKSSVYASENFELKQVRVTCSPLEARFIILMKNDGIPIEYKKNLNSLYQNFIVLIRRR